jgi:hypothetical protein
MPLKTTNWEGKHMQGGEQELMRSTDAEKDQQGETSRLSGTSTRKKRKRNCKSCKRPPGSARTLSPR